MPNDKDPIEPKMRRTLDQKLAEIRAAEAKIHAARRAKRTHGLIKIGGTLVAEAGASASIHDWLHHLWLKIGSRDREAIEIATETLDVTKPSKRVGSTQQPSEVTEPKKTSDNDLEATNKTSATHVTAKHATSPINSSPQSPPPQKAAATTSDITKTNVDDKESKGTPLEATHVSHGASSTGPSHQGFQPHQNFRPSQASVATSNEKMPDPVAPVASRTVLPVVATRPYFQSQHPVSPTKTELSNTADVERAPNITPAGGTPVTKTTLSPVVPPTVNVKET